MSNGVARNDGWGVALSIIGGLTILLGLMLCVGVIASASERSFFNPQGELSGGAIMIALGIAFYHLIAAMLCFGVATVLREATQAASDVGALLAPKAAMTGQPLPSKSAVTKCGNCGRVYTADEVHGQFCGSCGRMLNAEI
jgi:hypothetical protein